MDDTPNQPTEEAKAKVRQSLSRALMVTLCTMSKEFPDKFNNENRKMHELAAAVIQDVAVYLVEKGDPEAAAVYIACLRRKEFADLVAVITGSFILGFNAHRNLSKIVPATQMPPVKEAPEAFSA